MEKTTEIELKFEILNIKKLQNFLNNLTFKVKKRVKDIYLDTLDGDLYKKGVFIRIRNDKTLDFKFNLDEISKDATKIKLNHTHCDEYNFTLPLTKESLKDLNEVAQLLGMKTVEKADLEEFKTKNNIIEPVVLDRERQYYTSNKFDIIVDNIEDLGQYLEIERLAKVDDDMEQIKEEMKQFLKGLDLKYVNTGFNELYWRKHDFKLYLQGKFLLDEDFKKYRS